MIRFFKIKLVCRMDLFTFALFYCSQYCYLSTQIAWFTYMSWKEMNWLPGVINQTITNSFATKPVTMSDVIHVAIQGITVSEGINDGKTWEHTYTTTNHTTGKQYGHFHWSKIWRGPGHTWYTYMGISPPSTRVKRFTCDTHCQQEIKYIWCSFYKEGILKIC